MATANRSRPYQPVPAGGVFDVVDRMFASTPAYRGDGQPASQSGGVLAVLGNLFGSTTPVYRTTSATPPGDCNCEPVELSDDATPSDPCTDSPGTLPGTGDSAPLTIVITRD